MPYLFVYLFIYLFIYFHIEYSLSNWPNPKPIVSTKSFFPWLDPRIKTEMINIAVFTNFSF